jgi:hypothetical protein
MFFSEVGIEKHNFVVRVAGQEGSEQVAFIPCPSIFNPAFRVFKRPENIVEMDQHAAFQSRQDIEKNMKNIASDLADMTGIDE